MGQNHVFQLVSLTSMLRKGSRCDGATIRCAENVASLSSLYYSVLDPDLILDGYLFAAAIQS